MPNSADAHVRLGVVLKEAKRLEKAESEFRCAISLHGDNVVAHYNLGIVLTETNRPWEAEQHLRTAIKLLPNFVEAHNALGIVLMTGRRFAEAEAALRRALALKPDFPAVHRELDKVLVEIGRQAKVDIEVEAECRRELALAPDSAGGYIKLGTLLTRTKRYAEAESTLRRAIDVDGDNALALHALADVLAQTGRASESETALRRAVASKPDFVDAIVRLGSVFAATHRPFEAEASYRRALELRPDEAEAYNGLGLVLKDLHRLQDAGAALHRATMLRPDFEAAHWNLRLLRRQIGYLSQAEEAYREDAKLRPDSAASHFKLALPLLLLGKLDEAKLELEKVLAIEPANAEAHRLLGQTFILRRNFDEAIACYLRALSIKPKFAGAMAGLGLAFAMREQLAEALKWIQAALAAEPSHMEANRLVASILLRSGREQDAKPYLDQASLKPPVYIEYATSPVRTVLVLWTAAKDGNMPTVELLFPATVNTRLNWVMLSADDDQSAELPYYDLVFNAMGDPDLIGDASRALDRFALACDKPLLNPPGKVALTARDKLPLLLGEIENIAVPPVRRFASSADWEDSVADGLPLLIRPVTSHGGTGLVLAKTVAELAPVRQSQSGPVYVCPFVDFRSEDSWFRKYRVIFIDRKPYPYHLAVSKNWMVHYYTADMESFSWKLEEEKLFLRDPEAVLGRSGMRALESIGATIDLEYCGIDFSILPDKRILVFEANPTMLVHPEAISGPLEHKNTYVFRIQDRFEEMLNRFCRRGYPRSAGQ